MENECLLEMTGINKSFPGVRALDNAGIRLRAGSVHALMGENGAGKSTLMKCLFGIYRKDSGSIRLCGEEVSFASPRAALDHGVAMVHQELNQVLFRSVMENIWLGRFPKRFGVVDHKRMAADTKRVLDGLEIDIDPASIVGTLSVSQRQMVEIARAVSSNARVLVLDEPTSSLTEEEVEHLFRILRKLCEGGAGIIYISHRMSEIKRIADEVTVMRDGRLVATRACADITVDEIIKLMVDRNMSERFPPKTNRPGEVLMRVENLTGKHEPACKDVSFTLRAGEVLGVAGLVGSRRTELLCTLFGINARESGAVYVADKPIENKNAQTAVRNGFALITEERRASGIFPDGDVQFNATLANRRAYWKGPALSGRKMAADAQWVIDSLNVKTPSQRTLMKYLSGGNQQKVIIGRWLLTKPRIMLLDEPTRGIDVGAKYEIYQLILQLAGEGKGVVVVSSEMPELIGICDRILVMSNGRLAGEVDMHAQTENVQEVIMRLATRYV